MINVYAGIVYNLNNFNNLVTSFPFLLLVPLYWNIMIKGVLETW